MLGIDTFSIEIKAWPVSVDPYICRTTLPGLNKFDSAIEK
jgi:hypothetical protein